MHLPRYWAAVSFVAASILAILFLSSAHGAPPLPRVSPAPPCQSKSKPADSQKPLDLDTVLSFKSLTPKGHWYKATVPATLDLAARAKLSINALTGDVLPSKFYGVAQGFKFNANPPYIEGSGVLYGITLTPRNVRTLPMLRAMSGSDYKLDVEYGMMRALMSQIAKDGRMYYPGEAGRPAGGTSYPEREGMMIFAMLNWRYRDGNSAWVKWIDLLAKGLRQDAIRVHDRAYYPLQSSIDANGKWHDLAGADKSPTAYHTPDEPSADPQGIEGATKSDQDRPMNALADDFELTGNRDSLKLANRLAREIMRPGMWDDTSAEGYPGNEHGIFVGHFHNNVHSLVALLELGMVNHDQRLMEIAREGYDQAVRNGVVRMGWFPAWIEPAKYGRPAWLHGVTEACGLGDVVVLATQLSKAGLGDYWDDVDSIVRNQLITQQISDLNLMRQVSGGGHEHDALLKRFVGGFGLGGLTSIPQTCDIAGCCSGNAAQGLYYAWYGITQFDHGVATVNLFLNRASAWMDIDSYLPYEGKVVLHNKQARTALVRIPRWVNADDVRSYVDGKAVQPAYAGSYLVFDGLKPKDQIRLEFPVREETDRYTIDAKRYTVLFRGSTVIDISPRDQDQNNYPLYKRDYMRAPKAPMKTVRRFVADRLIPLGTY